MERRTRPVTGDADHEGTTDLPTVQCTKGIWRVDKGEL
jgi:hypothetical protein